MPRLQRITRPRHWLLVLLTLVPVVQAAPVTRTLDVPVSASQAYTQMTPVAVHDGHVFMTTIEPGPSGDGPNTNDLRIAVRQGVPDGSGGYTWTRHVVETRGVFDIWHTAPSIGVDEAGYVHVAYNMHNFPWQYRVSRRPLDISAGFDFRGQTITQAELDRSTFQNETRFPDLGTAAIPGNQITYPHFENDRNGRLYLTYRFAAKPARGFKQRTFSTGVASYDAGSRTWRSMGGLLDYAAGDYTGPATSAATLRSLASRSGWTSYSPRPTFGPGGELSMSTLWRAGTAGATTSNPCLFRTRDGEAFTTVTGATVTVPVQPGDCPNITSTVPGSDYLSLGDAASDQAGNPYLILSPVGRLRELHHWNGTRWSKEPSPGGAVEIFFDDEWNLWGVAQGLSLYLKRRGSSEWETIEQANSTVDCLPHAALDPGDRSVVHVFAMGCSADRGTVTRYDLRQLRGDAVASAPLVTPLTLPRNRWQQISLPFTANDMTPVGVFSALPAARYGDDWAIFGFDARTGAYFEQDPNDALTPGRGYWVIQDVRSEATVTAPADARPVLGTGSRACNGVACADVPLSVGTGNALPVAWNMGAVPVPRAAPLDDLRVASTTSGCRDGCTLDEAFEADLSAPALYRYNPVDGEYDTLGSGAVVNPWDGYWAAALPAAGSNGVRLLFPVTEVTGNNTVSRPVVPPPESEPPGSTRGPTVDDRALDG